MLGHKILLVFVTRCHIAPDWAFVRLNLSQSSRRREFVQDSQFFVTKRWIEFSQEFDSVEACVADRFDLVAFDRLECLQNVDSKLNDVLLASRRQRIKRINAHLLRVCVIALDLFD